MSNERAEAAVERWTAAKEALDGFMADEDIRELFMEYHDLVEAYNQSLDEATRAVKTALTSSDRPKLIIGAIGAQKKAKRYYDAEFLANALPADQADEVLTEKITYDLDTDRLEQLLRQGEVDSEIVRAAYKEKPQSPSNMPGTPKPYVIPALPVE